MSWIDAGVNLLDPRFTLADVLSRSAQAGVNHLLVIASTIEESQRAIALCSQQNSLLYNESHPQTAGNQVKLACTAGIHPHYADDANNESWAKLKTTIADKNVSAIGECGLDFNRNFSTQANQLYAFEKQLDLAAEHDMGVYLHERDAFDAQITLLERYAPKLKFMVSHCFTGSKEQLEAYVSLGCYVGVTGWLCDDKRGQQLQQAVKTLPLTRLLLETDAPFLFPKSLRPRKSKNEPCFLPHIANTLASLLNVELSTIEDHAFKNAQRLFFMGRSENK